MKKRGISRIFLTIIILLIVAIGIVLSLIQNQEVIQNFISGDVKEIEASSSTIDLKIENVLVESDENVSVTVKRNSGGRDSFEIIDGEVYRIVEIGIKFVFSDGKNSEIHERNIKLKELEIKSFIFILNTLNASKITEILITPVFKSSSGKKKIVSVLDESLISEFNLNGDDDINDNGNNNTVETSVTSICGNSVIETGEICDSDSRSCTINGVPSTQRCNSQCNGYKSCVPLPVGKECLCIFNADAINFNCKYYNLKLCSYIEVFEFV